MAEIKKFDSLNSLKTDFSGIGKYLLWKSEDQKLGAVRKTSFKNKIRSGSQRIALGARLRKCRNVITLGFRPNFSDYTREETDLILNAGRIYYPTAFYANLFYAAGIDTFPSFNTYHFVQDKIRQSALFNLLKIPHPYTRVFYGPSQKSDILKFFRFPFVAKKARGSSMGMGVRLIVNEDDLCRYLDERDSGKDITGRESAVSEPAYIQEYCPHDRDIRVVVIGKEVILAYWRVSKDKEFRSNVACGGEIVFDAIPVRALEVALETAIRCGWDDVGLDLVEHKGEFVVIEANIKYGRSGFIRAGIDYNLMLENLIDQGKI